MEARIPEVGEAERARTAERRWRAAVLASVAIGCAVPVGYASAASITQRLVSTILFVLSKIFEVLTNFIGKLVILLVDAVIAVAQYNHFVDAAPVKAGWPLVRDVTNMFVIVILLAIAFGTIIGYQKLHYKGVLGKLLLMAVLVNFSKTFIGLLIDFSQVVMLTFVNAFRAAAGGNFTQALKLDRMLSLNSDVLAPQAAEDPSTVGDPLLYKAIIAQMLAVFFLGITATLLLIMLVYLIARIVGLWIALVLSPLALFMTAVPSVIAGKVSALADGYWGKLGTLVAGGPVMAFFIWLTLATVQGGGFGTFGIETGAGANEVAAIQASGFAHALGNVEDIATFFISVIMLLMGVDTAVSMGGSLSPVVARAMGKIRSAGTAGAKYAAYGGLAVPAYLGAKGGAKLARGLERRLDLAGKTGRLMQNVGLRLGAPTLAAQGAELMKVRRDERKKRGELYEKAFTGLTAAQRIEQYEKLAAKTIRDPAGARAAELALAKESVTLGGGLELAKRFTQEGKDAGLKGAALKAYTDDKVASYVRSKLDAFADTATREGDADGTKWVGEQREKNLNWMKGGLDIADIAAKRAETTPDTEITKIFTQASFANADVADGVLRGTDYLNQNGTVNQDSAWYKKLGKTMAGKAIEARMSALSAAGVSGAALYQLMKDPDPSEKLKELGMSGGRIVKNDRGTYEYLRPESYLSESRIAEQAAAGATVVPRNEPEVRAGLELLRRHRESLANHPDDAATITQLQETRLNTVASGARLSEVYPLDQGVFENNATREEFASDVAKIQTGARPDYAEYNKIDGLSLVQNARTYSDTRATFVENVDVRKLATAARDASAAAEFGGRPESKAALQNIGNLARAVDIQGSYVRKSLDQTYEATNANLSASQREGKKAVMIDQIYDAARNYRKAGSDVEEQTKAMNVLRKALTDEHLQADALSMNDAQTLLKQHELREDVVLQNYAQTASRRATDALRSAGATVRTEAGEAVRNVGRAARDTGAGIAAGIGGAAGAAAAAGARGVEAAAGAASSAARAGARGVSEAAGAVRRNVTPSGRRERRMEQAGNEYDEEQAVRRGRRPGGGDQQT